MDSLRPDYAEMERAFAALEKRRQAGEIDAQAYRDGLNALRFKDDEGHTWMLQERTGRWHVWRHGAWEAGTPPGWVAEPAAPPPPPAEPWERVPSGAPEPPSPVIDGPEPQALAPEEVAESAAPPPAIAGPDASALPPAQPLSMAPAPAGGPGPIAPPPPAPASMPPSPPLTTAPAPAGGPGPLAPPPPAPASMQPPPPLTTAPAPAIPSVPPPPPAGPVAVAPVAPPPVQPVGGEAGRRAARREARRYGGSYRPGCLKIIWSILKWEIVWGAAGWLAYETLGQRYPKVLIPVALLAVLTMVLYLRRFGRSGMEGAA